MERIKQALELARQAREKAGLTELQPASAQPMVSSGPIAYTQTQTVNVPSALLESNRIISKSDNDNFINAYKILRTQVLQRLRAEGNDKYNSLAITSAGDSEGKSLTAINLGISLAMEVDHTVLLVDANLRNPSVHTYLGINPEKGLSDYLTSDSNEHKISDLLIHVEGIPRFVILPGGKPLTNSSEMLSSPKMLRLVEELKERYPSRIVLFDLPPLLTAADAMAFSPYVDAALMVVEEGKTQADELSRARDLLNDTTFIGAVLNKAYDQETENSSGLLDSLPRPQWLNRIWAKVSG